MDNIINILIERGYTEKAANIVAKDLLNLQDDLKEAAEQWIATAKEPIVSSNGYSTKLLMEKYPGMIYAAALLTIDWLGQEPEKAKQIINYGIK